MHSLWLGHLITTGVALAILGIFFLCLRRLNRSVGKRKVRSPIGGAMNVLLHLASPFSVTVRSFLFARRLVARWDHNRHNSRWN